MNGFNYVDISCKGCEGWLNLFFNDACIALVRDLEVAEEMRKQVPRRELVKNKE